MVTHRIVAYLLSLAVGYWVLTLAEKEKNNTKKIGKVIGWIIIVASLIGPLCLAGSAMRCASHSEACAYSSNCPWTGHHSMMDDKEMMNGQGMMGDKDKAK